MIVESQRRNDAHIARAYAEELTNLRRTIKVISGAKLAFEQVKLRLDTVSSMGDIVVTLSPCMSVIKGLSPMIAGIVPEADASMQDLTSMLGSILNESSVSHTGELVPPVQLGRRGRRYSGAGKRNGCRRGFQDYSQSARHAGASAGRAAGGACSRTRRLPAA